jgi:hypothetical protein
MAVFTAPLPEYEIHSAEDTQRRPEIVELQRLADVEQYEWHEHAERDHLLQDLELRQRHDGIADAVARDLQQVLEQRDAPAGQRRDEPFAVGEVPQVGVPGEGHEHVGSGEQQDRACDR